MKINNNWKFKDLVTGITFGIVEGKALDRLHLDLPTEKNKVNNRDFFFTKDGKFDGTGSALSEPHNQNEQLRDKTDIEELVE